MNGPHAASTLKALQQHLGYTNAEVISRSRALGEDFALGSNWLSNVRSRDAVPDLRKMHAISEIFRVGLGDLFALFGFDLRHLATTSESIHATRTHLIEQRLTGFERLRVPMVLADGTVPPSHVYLDKIVREWCDVPASHIYGQAWQSPRIFYGKLGIHDSDSAPTIPPGAYIQVLQMDERSLTSLTPTSIYLIQHAGGLIACRCILQNGMLYLRSANPSYAGPIQLRLGYQARLLGRIIAFAAPLPAEPYQRGMAFKARSTGTPPLAPWEFQRPNDLFFEQYRRTGWTRKEFDQAALPLRNYHDAIDVSAKYVEELRSSEHFPRTSTALALSVLTGTRLSDVLASCGIRRIRPRFQISEFFRLDRQELFEEPRIAPRPQEQRSWSSLMEGIEEWPLLLQHLFNREPLWPRSVLRYTRRASLDSLPDFVPDPAFLFLQPYRAGYGSLNEDARRSDWSRRLFVIEHGRDEQRLECGYLYFEDNRVILTSHPSASTMRTLVLPKNGLTIVGVVEGIAGSLPR